MKPILIPFSTDSRGRPTSDHVLSLEGTRFRFGVGVVAKGAEARKDFGGPMVPGPWSYAFGLCSVIDNQGGTGAEISRNKAAKREHVVRDGSLLLIEGETYRVRVERHEFLKLDLVASTPCDACEGEDLDSLEVWNLCAACDREASAAFNSSRAANLGQSRREE